MRAENNGTTMGTLSTTDMSKLGVMVFRQPRGMRVTQGLKEHSGCRVEDSE